MRTSGLQLYTVAEHGYLHCGETAAGHFVKMVHNGRDRLSKRETALWRVDLSVGWFEAIAAGELKQTSDVVSRFTGKMPLKLEEYFAAFPELLPTRSI